MVKREGTESCKKMTAKRNKSIHTSLPIFFLLPLSALLPALPITSSNTTEKAKAMLSFFLPNQNNKNKTKTDNIKHVTVFFHLMRILAYYS